MKKLLPISVEDFERIAPRLSPCELVKGEIIPMSPGHFKHSRVTMNIAFVLEAYARRTKTGRILTNEAGMVVKKDLDTVRGGDVVFISYKRLPAARTYKGFLRIAPELVVGVLGEDDTWKDLEEKTEEYRSFGVDMVWVVDPKTLSVRLYPRRGEPYVLHEKDEISGGKILPGFSCGVSEFFVD